MIPKKLSDWNLDTIKLLLEQGYYECEFFDFKEMLPPSQDAVGKIRLTKACCAFANKNDGGFLVFGISDKKNLPADQRLVGIDAALDFPEQFGNYPIKCTPSVEWEFLNPPLKLPNSKVIHVIHIKQSFLAPVGFEDVSKGWFFPKRTNKGDELMTYNEIKLYFMNFYEKRIKLQLLLAELETIKSASTDLIIPDNQLASNYSLVKYDLRVLESVLSDTYTVLHNELDLIKNLNLIRSTCMLVNNKMAIYHSSAMLPLSNRDVVNRTHNMWVNLRVNKIIPQVDACIEILKKVTNTI